MSGIAGIVYPDILKVNNLISPMLDIVGHKDKGEIFFHTHHHIQVGSCSKQATINNIVAAIDGKILNSHELCQQIPSLNGSGKQLTDSELLIHAYQFWGYNFLEHIKGEFALFILDKNNEEILIARDRLGKKPLYWFYNDEYFTFASEIKSLLASGIVPQTIAPDAVATYLYFGYLPQDLTLIKGVNKLLPGNYLILNKNRSETIQSYWSYSSFFLKDKNEKKDEIVQKVDEFLKFSIKNRLPENNKPIACLMAGGLGSSSIAYYLSKFFPADLISGKTVEFQGETTTDTHAALAVAQSLKIKDDCSIVSPDNFIDDLVKIVWHLDEPIADPNIVATWRLALSAKPEGFFFSGMGSDELLAGHTRYTSHERTATYRNRIIQAIMPLMKKFLIPFLTQLYKPAAYSILKQCRTNPWQLNYLEQNALFPESVRTEAAPSIAGLFDPIVFLHKFHNLPEITSIVSSFVYLDVKTRLADCYIAQYEKLMSANKVSWQAPFLDESLVEYLASVQDYDKNAEKDPSYILKTILKNDIPSSVLNRPKKTRRHFLEAWADNPKLVNLFSLLLKGALVETGLISKKWIEEQLSSPLRIKESFKMLWSLLILEIWFALFVNQPMQIEPPNISPIQLLQGD